jgi:hypothetical protein
VFCSLEHALILTAHLIHDMHVAMCGHSRTRQETQHDSMQINNSKAVAMRLD